MKCKSCQAGKRIRRNEHRCVLCIPYGMILKEDHECEREGWKHYDRTDGDREVFGEGTELQEDGSDDADGLPGVLSKPGERERIPGMEDDERTA